MNGVQTAKKSKSVYIIGAITLGIIALLTVYFVLIATGVISAEPIRITISSASGSREYNGKEYTLDEWKIEEGELKEGHTLSVTVTGGRTDAGESENTLVAIVLDERGYDVTDSYGISYKPGRLTVSPRKIVVASASAEKNYDGTPLTAKSCALMEGALVAGHELVYTVNGTLTAAGKTDNTFIATVTDGKRDVSENYAIEYLRGTLYVHGEILNIKTASATKTYDGTPLTAAAWTLTSGTLRDGDRVVVKVSGTQTEIGESENVASLEVRDAAGAVVTPMYEAVFDFGTLTVKPVTIYAETQPAYKVYDGTPLTADGWRIMSDGLPGIWLKSGRSAVAGEYIVTATVVGSRTDAGTEENAAVFEVTKKDGTPAEGVVVECKAGALTVALRNLTVQSGTKGKEYDGTPLTCNEYEVVSITQPAEGHKLEVAISGTITFKGIVDNTIAEVKITDEKGNDVTHNYNIKPQEGKLSIFAPDGSGDEPGGDEPGGDEPGGNTPGGSGSGGGDVDGSGNLGGGDIDGSEEPVTVMQIRAGKSGNIYLRQKSFGDYAFNSWKDAEQYGEHIVKAGALGKDVAYGMNYLSAIALSSCGTEYDRLEVRPVGIKKYYLPLFTALPELNYTVQSSDVEYTANSAEYALYYYSYDYVRDGGALLAGAKLGEYEQIEKAYREFVYERYLSVPDSTREYMQTLIGEHGFDGLSGAERIAAVAAYVRGAAKYNLKYDRALDDEPDVAVAFLDKYKEGICQHYATAATLIFRTLGIPARYVVGYSASSTENEWCDVTGKQAHAWVEAYIDGAGWINVEVTGGGGGFDGNGDSGESDIGNPLSDKKLTIKPFDVYLHYDEFVSSGTPLTYALDTLQGLSALEKQGYRYEFTVSGAQSDLGIGSSKIEALKIFDADGEDVTNDYAITLQTGKLQIYMQEISVATGSHEKIYDGKPLTGVAEDLTCTGVLLAGHAISDAVISGGRKNAGKSPNIITPVITDGSGEDVTYMYKINYTYGTLTVTVRSITVTADSSVGYLTELGGAPLTCDGYSIDGEICEGEEINVKIRGAQASVGRSGNTVESVIVTDSDGNDVTENYSVTVVDGTLTVLPRRPVQAARGEGD